VSIDVGQLQFYLFDRVSNDAAISERLELLHFQMLQLGRFAGHTEAWVLDLDEGEVGVSLEVGRASAFVLPRPWCAPTPFKSLQRWRQI
jgi:hypothetical protein